MVWSPSSPESESSTTPSPRSDRSAVTSVTSVSKSYTSTSKWAESPSVSSLPSRKLTEISEGGVFSSSDITEGDNTLSTIWCSTKAKPSTEPLSPMSNSTQR